MKNKILLLLVSFCVFQSNGQDLLKEITKTFENGKPMFIDYLEMEDLKKVKTEIFNESGTLIFSVQFNKDTGKYDGEFYDLINKGYFKDGVLNCNNCMLVEANKPSVYTYNHDRQNTLVTKGNVVNGRLTGKVERYTLHEGSYSKVDWESTRKYVDAGAGSGFRDVKTYRTGQFNKTQLPTFNYNSNGVLDGEQVFEYKYGEMRRQKLNFENGIVKSRVTYDSNNLIIDSLFNENKIWKINKKFVKNDGFLVFSGLSKYSNAGFEGYSVEFINLNYYRSKELISDWERNEASDGDKFEDYYGATDNNGIIPLGGSHVFSWEEFLSRNVYDREKTIKTGGPKLGLDANGLYSISLKGMFDNIIYYDLEQTNSYNSGKSDFYYADNSSRKKNLLVLIYNYLINRMDDNLSQKFYSYDYAETNNSLVTFVNALSSDHYLEQKSPIALRKNSFKKHVKSKNLPWIRESEKSRSFVTLDSFFTNIISMTDYLKACKESIDNNETEIQYLMIWNSVNKKYDKVDFDKLIELSIEKEAKAKLEAKPKAEEERLAVLTDEEIVKKESEAKKPIENLELWYSSEKSSDFHLKQISKQLKDLNSYYSLNLLKIEIHRVPGNKDATEAFTFYYFKDLNGLKKLEQLSSENKSVNLYHKDENNLILVYNAKK